VAEKFFDFQFEGMDALIAAFDELGAALAKEVLQKALKKAAEPVADEMRALAPRGDDPNAKRRISESIVISTSLPKNQRRLRAQAGTLKDFAEVFVYVNAPHAHLVEFGHRLVVGKRATTRKGRKNQTLRVIGRVPAHPFARPAWDARKEEAFELLKSEVWKVLEATAKRLATQARTGKLSRKSALSIASALDAKEGG